MLCADHGPCVSGAHNSIVTARAGKDLVSCLVTGNCYHLKAFSLDLKLHQFIPASKSWIGLEMLVEIITDENFVK